MSAAVKPAKAEKQGFDLFHFVNLSGERGRQWVEEYETSGCAELKARIQACLFLLHDRKFEEAKSILERSHAELQTKDVEPSILHVIGRWYHGILAYYHYANEDYDEAEAELDRGHAAIRAGIDAHRFCTFLATHCMDFEIQAARINRQRRCWSEMRRHLNCSRDMILGKIPFCTLSDGTPIMLSTLEEYFDGLPLGDAEKDATSEFFDDAAKGETLDRHLRQMYSLPGLVVSYP